MIPLMAVFVCSAIKGLYGSLRSAYFSCTGIIGFLGFPFTRFFLVYGHHKASMVPVLPFFSRAWASYEEQDPQLYIYFIGEKLAEYKILFSCFSNIGKTRGINPSTHS
jgi:hypothetical protein